MQFDPINPSSLQQIGRLNDDVDQVRQYAAVLASTLGEIFKAAKSRWEITFTASDDTSFELSGPFGLVRAKLILGMEDAGLFGRFVIQKQIHDEYDRMLWTTIWAIRVSKGGDVRAGDTGPALYNVWQSLRDEDFVLKRQLAESIIWVAMQAK